MSIIDEIIAKEVCWHITDEGDYVPVEALEQLRPYVELGEMMYDLFPDKLTHMMDRGTQTHKRYYDKISTLIQQIREQENGRTE